MRIGTVVEDNRKLSVTLYITTVAYRNGLMLNSLDASRHAELVDMLRFSDSFRQKLALNPAEMTRCYKDECPTDPELTGRQRKYYSQIRQKIEQEMTMRNVEAGCVHSARI